MSVREPLAYAKIASRNDVIPPFYITDDYVKARDETGPTRIEVILGRFSDYYLALYVLHDKNLFGSIQIPSPRRAYR